MLRPPSLFQRMAESEECVRELSGDREAGERERWNLLQSLHQEAEKVSKLTQQLASREKEVDAVSD